MATLNISNILELFSLHNYTMHANKLNINSGMRDMLIGLYGNLLDFAKDESNPNTYSTLKEIINQYNVVAIVAPLDDTIKSLDTNMINLQKQLDEKNIEIAELRAQLVDKTNKITELKTELQDSYQRY